MATIENNLSKLPPFPSDVPLAALKNISLQRLLSDTDSHEESLQMFEACKKLGFFRLDLRNCDLGESLIQDSNELISIGQQFIPMREDEKKMCTSDHLVYGYDMSFDQLREYNIWLRYSSQIL